MGINLRVGFLFIFISVWIPAKRVHEFLPKRLGVPEHPGPGDWRVLAAIAAAHHPQRGFNPITKPPVSLCPCLLSKFAAVRLDVLLGINDHGSTVLVHFQQSIITSESADLLWLRRTGRRLWPSWSVRCRPQLVDEPLWGSESIGKKRRSRMGRP